jgi:hypothetical protein
MSSFARFASCCACHCRVDMFVLSCDGRIYYLRSYFKVRVQCTVFILLRSFSSECGSFSNKASPSFSVFRDVLLSFSRYFLFVCDIFPDMLLHLRLGFPVRLIIFEIFFSLSCSQQPTTGPYIQLNYSSPHPSILSILYPF